VAEGRQVIVIVITIIIIITITSANMGTFKLVLVGILALTFMVFVTFFGRLPALRNTPIAGLHKLIWIHIPNATMAVDQRLTSGRISRSVKRSFNFMMYDRHPTVVIMFILIMAVAEYFYLPEAWPEMGWFTKLTASITAFLPYLFLYLSCAADPGYITPENHEYHMYLYPYDFGVFHPGIECQTCRFMKPARSKHCRTCKRCVAKSDHHCIFINSCVGYGNQHWFLLLLLSTATLTSYGGFLGLSIIGSMLRRRNPAWTMWPSKDLTYSKWISVWGWGIQRNAKLGATTLLALLTSPLVWGLFLYTFYLVYCGTTTNESLKWSGLQEDMADGYAFKRHLPPNRRKDRRFESDKTRWPVEPEQIIMVTQDGAPPSPNSRVHGEGPWERVHKLRDVENLYDLGLWENLADIFLPHYGFGNQGDEPNVERIRMVKKTAKGFDHIK
jgi:hypothetical protein